MTRLNYHRQRLGFAMLPALVLLSLCAIALGWAMSINAGNTKARSGGAVSLAHRAQIEVWGAQHSHDQVQCWSASCFSNDCTLGCKMGYFDSNIGHCIASVQVVSRATPGWRQADISASAVLIPDIVQPHAAQVGLIRRDWYCPILSATEITSRIRVTLLIEESQTWSEVWLTRSVPLSSLAP